MPVCIFTRPHAKDVIHFDLSQVMNTVSFSFQERTTLKTGLSLPQSKPQVEPNRDHFLTRLNIFGTKGQLWVSSGMLLFPLRETSRQVKPHLLPASHPAPTYCTAWMPACLLETGGKASKIRPLRSKMGTTAFSVRAHCTSWVIAYQCVKI